MAHFEQRSPAEVGDDSAAAGRSMCSVAALVSRGGVREAVAVWNMRTFKRVHSFSLDADARTRVAGILSAMGASCWRPVQTAARASFDSASRAEVRPSRLLCHKC